MLQVVILTPFLQLAPFLIPAQAAIQVQMWGLNHFGDSSVCSFVGPNGGMTFDAYITAGTCCAGPLSYQWLKDGVVIARSPQTTGRLTILGGSLTNYGDYSVILTDSNGSVRSNPVRWHVVLPQNPPELMLDPFSDPYTPVTTVKPNIENSSFSFNHTFEYRAIPAFPDNSLPSVPPAAWGVVAVAGPAAQVQCPYYPVDCFVSYRYRYHLPTGCLQDWSSFSTPVRIKGVFSKVADFFDTTIGMYDSTRSTVSGGTIADTESRYQSYIQPADSITSMLTKSGAPWTGELLHSSSQLNSYGLIQAYSTLLDMAKFLSVRSGALQPHPLATDSLLFLSGRLCNLHLFLANEAYADAADPTIATGSFQTQATTLYSFSGLPGVTSVLEEELALLRGLPNSAGFPLFNRLRWNIDPGGVVGDGQIAYSLDYDIRDQDGNGKIDLTDARLQYPQGHGDAWGHYLSAIKPYYRLLREVNYTWDRRGELVNGTTVDFRDERLFAHSASARAKTGSEIVNLTYRALYEESPSQGFQLALFQDADTNRAWSVSEWASRAGQGALFDWAVANVLLPAQNTNAGVGKVDRTTVPEIGEIASSFQDIQGEADKLDLGLNPMGLARNVVPFDIDPSLMVPGPSSRSHFEQIYDRAKQGLKNAKTLFNSAQNASQALRRQADSATDFQQTTIQRENDYTNRLIEIFGTPWRDDIGGNGFYSAGYAGPDLVHWMYNDSALLIEDGPITNREFSVVLEDVFVATNGAISRNTNGAKFNIDMADFGIIKPPAWNQARTSPGEVQIAQRQLFEAIRRFEKGMTEYDNHLALIDDLAQLLTAQYRINSQELQIYYGAQTKIQILNERIRRAREEQIRLQNKAKKRRGFAKFVSAGVNVVAAVIAPQSVAHPQSATAIADGVGEWQASRFDSQAAVASLGELEAQQAKEMVEYELRIRLAQLHQEQEIQLKIKELEQMVRKEASLRLELYALDEALDESVARLAAVVARGGRLLEEQLRFRQQTASQVQLYRQQDIGFRIFRNQALQQYRAMFDLAARYTYLAAAAYDYETNFKPGDSRGPGDIFFTSIVRARAIGLMSGTDDPLPSGGNGDGGLADPLARMYQNFENLRGSLGLNNLQHEVGRFSLRTELFRVQTNTTSSAASAAWREVLARSVVANLPDLPEFQRYCAPPSGYSAVGPGIVIPFETVIKFRKNFFGWDLSAGDNNFSSTDLATKIRSVGVWFANYNITGLPNTPRVYLVPVGSDIMRSPRRSQDPPDLIETRAWKIVDQLLPVPFQLSPGSQSPGWIPIRDSLSGEYGAIRQFGDLRAYHDAGFDQTQTTYNTRLVGRSVWNTRWILIIPGGALDGAQPSRGIQTFIYGPARDGNGVSDIKLYFDVYGYSQ